MPNTERRSGIERRIVTSILTVGVLPMIVVVIAGYFAARGAQSLAVEQTLSVAVNRTAAGLVLASDMLLRGPRSLSRDSRIIDYLELIADGGKGSAWGSLEAEVQALLDREGATADGGGTIFSLYTLKGELVLSSDRSRALQTLDLASLENNENGSIAEVGFSVAKNRYEGAFAAPVVLPETSLRVGFVCEELGINTLFAFTMESKDVGQDGVSEPIYHQVAIINEETGLMAVSYAPESRTNDYPALVIEGLDPSVEKILQEGKTAGSLLIKGYTIGQETKDVFLAYHKLETPEGIYLITYRPAAETFQSINTMATMAVVVCMLFIAFLCFNAYRNVHNNIVRPLALLNEGAQIIRQGDLDLKLKIDTGDEIEAVASSFNRMALALSHNIGQLEESEEKYRTLVTSIREGIYQTDPNGVITFINPVGAETFAFSRPEDVMGKNIRDFFLEESDFEKITSELEVKGFLERSRLWMKCIDGRTICVSLSSNQIYDDRGKVVGTEGIFHDVTKNVRLEQEARERSERISAINQIANVINSSLEAGRLYESLVVELRKLVHFDYAAVALVNAGGDGFDARQLWPEREVPPGSTYILDGVSSCTAWVMGERRCLVVNDGEAEEWSFEGAFPEETVSCLCVPLYATGRIIGTLNLGANNRGAFSRHDVNVLEEMAPHVAVAIRNAQLLVNLQLSLEEVTRAREKLHEANEKLKTLDEMKTNLLSNVSHELRTPLVSVMGYTDMIYNGKAGPVTETQRDYLSISMRNVDKLVTLIENLLDFSRLHRGDEKLIFNTFDLVNCAQSSIDIIRPVADAREIRVELKAPPNGVFVEGDKGKLVQVFNNLLSNAVKFNHDKGTVTVEIHRRSETAEVVISDTGIGIPEEALDKVFTRFYQYDSSSTRRYGGTGIGLSIALDIVRLHGSSISVSSEVGQGSSFRFAVPLSTEPEELDLMGAEALAEPTETHLLVEVVTHDRALSSQIRYVFSSEGMDVINASGGDHAIALAKKHNPDCILVEADSNGSDPSLVDELLSDSTTAEIPLILLADDDEVYERYRSSVVARIKRNFRKSTLLGAVHQSVSQGVGTKLLTGDKILCVDDDPDVLMFMRRCLDSEGFSTEQCESGTEALRLIESGEFGLVFLDIAMPGMDGWETCRRIKSRRERANVKVYVVTAKPIDKSTSRIKDSGADGYLMKPFRSEDLIQLVENLDIHRSVLKA